MGDDMIKNKTIGVEKNIADYEILNHHVLEGMADWVRVVDKEGTIIYVNSAMKNDLDEDMVGMKCHESYCSTIECDFCITQRSIRTGETIQKEEKILGNYYSIKSSPVRNKDGEIFAAVEVFRNITRERKLEFELIHKNKKMSRDLKFAKRIQEKILPKKGMGNSFKLDYIYRPSEMLGGDMFDMFNIDEENVGVYISDVVGHGISASMMTMFIRQTIRVMAKEMKDPSRAIKLLYEKFETLDLEVDRYFTIFYGVYNKKTKILQYVNAGHNCVPIKYNENARELLENRGLPVSILFDNMNHRIKETTLLPGDKLLFYTDGITESKDFNGREFGLDGLLEIVDNHPNDILGIIEDKIINHSWGEQIDDFAIVLFEVQ